MSRYEFSYRDSICENDITCQYSKNACSSYSCVPGPCQCCCVGPTGPAGPISTILGSYATLGALIAAHPTGNAGDAYLVNGALYIWSTATNQWENVGNLSGPTGPTGPTGATGPTGPAGVITGSVDTVDDLPNPGNPGDMYLVDGVLYVWNETTQSWEEMGDLRGPTGPAGVITGSVDTVDDLPDPGNPGDMYLVDGVLYVWNETTQSWEEMGDLRGPTGPAGVITGSVDTVDDLPDPGNPGDMYLVDGVLYVWNETTQSWEEMGDLRGPTGDTGPTGVITGSVDTVDDLPDPGNPGDMYLVDGVLYVWNETTQSWEEMGDLRGPAGPAGTAYTIIPFASQIAPYTHVSGGNPTRVSLVGFGYGDGRIQSDVLDYSFTIGATDRSFNLDANGNYQLVFSLPFDMTLRSIALTTGNYGDFDPTGELFPSIQLYSAGPTSNTFMPITGAVAEPVLPLGPGHVPANNMRAVVADGMEINLEAGTRIAIGALARMTNDTNTHSYYLYYTGGIGLTPWIR